MTPARRHDVEPARGRRPRPAGGRPGGARAGSGACSGEKKIASQPSAISPVELQVLRADRGEVQRDVVAHRVQRQLQRLAGAVRQRQV